MTIQEEAEHSDNIRKFTRMFNRRMMVGKTKVKEGSLWVRIRPPTIEESSMAQEDHRTLPFLRVGSVGTIIEDESRFIDLSIAGDRLLIDREEFLSTWTRVIEPDEWRKSQEMWLREVNAVRSRDV